MSNQNDFDENASSRTTAAPYTPRHPVPTIQGYEEHQEQRNAAAIEPNVETTPKESEESKVHAVIESAKAHLGLASSSTEDRPDQEVPYRSQNRNTEPVASQNGGGGKEEKNDELVEGKNRDSGEDGNGGNSQDPSQSISNELDPRQKRKNMKHMKRDTTGREVTDPVTHLPVTIHDFTKSDLKKVPENTPPAGSNPRSSTGFSAASKSETQLGKETEQAQAEHRGMEKLFPPPNFQAVQERLARVYSTALTFGLGFVAATTSLMLVVNYLISVSTISKRSSESSASWLRLSMWSATILMIGTAIGTGLVWGVRGWLRTRISDVWEDQVWDEARKEEEESANSPTPESTQWLNSLLSSVWSLINPDLFASLADKLEDVMQASLPKLVRMISVEDLGQGSEAIRILGIRWLPTGAAAKSVSVNGNTKPSKNKEETDRKVPGEGELADEPESFKGEESNQNGDYNHTDKDEEGDEENIAEGMEAEEGDFVNIEVGFSYRASSSGKSLKVKSKNAHLYLAFYLPGGIRFPVWVELRGIVGTMRIRLQLCPDPPFFALCTLTLLGQPKADLSCVPLTKKGLNIMDLPIISSFVQSSIDAALAEYVAPKSLTLDLKDMLIGDDFKKDTAARGCVMVTIKRAREFKEGDGNIGGLKKGSSDPYVAVGWAKFGKPVWSTRVIIDDMEPVWEETTFILVGPEELNAEESLRVQLWDSDRISADDDLGRVEIDLKELMHSSQSNGRMWDRHDNLLAVDLNEKMPGSLDWSVGYYAKSGIQEEQLKQRSEETGISTIQQLKDKVSQETERKMREATSKDESLEIEQQKAQDLKTREDSMIISIPPSNDYPTGILSIQIHQITGLEFEKINKNSGQGEEESDTEEGAGDLPSSYCTIILNHQKIFKTRTKPKNAKPFFNAGTERVIRDWRTTEVILSVRDSRVHENDPLLGIVYLPLGHILRKRSQIIETFPLVGGIGYGRARISIVFRSIQLQAPKELLGWDYGTLELTGPIVSNDIAPDLRGLRLKLRTTVHRSKMYSSNADERIQWTGKKDRPVRLAVRKRYCSCLVIEFRKSSLGLDKTLAFAVLWLKDIPDGEERIVTLPVWHGDADLKRAESNCIEDFGERMGSIDIPLKFWHGLSRYHQKLASKSPNLQDVFEVLDTANDSQEARNDLAEDEDVDSSSSSSDSSSTDDEGDNRLKREIRKKKSKISAAFTGGNGEDRNGGENDDGKRGPLDQIRDYKENSDQLHRRNRGLMQWKGARTAQWMKTKVKHGKDHVLDNFKHQEREPGIETEV